jgi:hypothetical protein
MNLILKNILRLILILTIQEVVLNKVPPLHQFIVPYFYFVFLLWLPFKVTRINLLFFAFGLGYLIDLFNNTPGLHIAVCVLLAYIRPPLIKLFLPKETTEWGNEEPSRKTMGQVPYAAYVVIMTILHNFYLILLEWLQFGDFLYFIGKLLATSFVSLLLIGLADLLISRNSRTR